MLLVDEVFSVGVAQQAPVVDIVIKLIARYKRMLPKASEAVSLRQRDRAAVDEVGRRPKSEDARLPELNAEVNLILSGSATAPPPSARWTAS